MKSNGGKFTVRCTHPTLMKKVTVIIPVYGVETYIAATVQSVLAQTYKHFELLLIDDGSPDRSLEICRQFTDPRIKILRQSNQGPAAARNLGIAHATGEYLAFLDGDDLWLPDKLAKHVQHLNRSPRVGVSFCRSALIDEHSQPLGIHQVITKLKNITPLDLLCRTPIGNGSVPVIRRAVFKDIQFVDRATQQLAFFNPDRRIHPSEDVECWLRIALCTAWKIEGIADALTLYRVHSRGFSADLFKKIDSWKHMLRAACTYGGAEMQRHKAPAMAYQYRHLARRAVSLREGTIAVQFIHAALITYPQILWEETYRTLQTLVAAYLICLLPLGMYRQVEAILMQMTGKVQKLRLSQAEQPIPSPRSHSPQQPTPALQLHRVSQQ